MDVKKFCSGYFMVLFLIVFNCGIYAFDEDYPDEDTQNVRCPWIRNKLKNGRVKIRSRGRIAKFLCDPGFELAGKRFATCVRGQWNNPIPVCVARGCPRKSSIANGRVTEMYRGAMLVYDCNPGYTLDSDASIYCDGRRWNRNPPRCVVTTPDPATACDFEDPDLCGWSHDPTHDFDWKRNQFSTPSGHVGTGPSYDHTFGVGKGGFYLYLEASSPRKTNDTARLFSPVYPRDYSGGCFVFWYHMYGETTGGLRVYLKPESHVFGELPPAWEKFGDQGNQWLQGRITIPKLNENFQLIIEGIRGSSYVGDSAIDDVRLTKSDCESMENATDTVEKTDADSCRGRCREIAEDNECGCNENCHATESCCSDYMMICPPGNDSLIDSTDESLPIDELGKPSSPVTVTIAKLTSTESFETAPTKHATSKSTVNRKSSATAVINSSTKMLTALTSTAPAMKTTSTMTSLSATISSFHDEIPLSTSKRVPTTKSTSVSTSEPTTAPNTQSSSSTMQLISSIAPSTSTTMQSTSSSTQSTSSTSQLISSIMQSSTISTIKPSTALTGISTTGISTTSTSVSTTQSESPSVSTAIANIITQEKSVSGMISSNSSVEEISTDKTTLQTAIPVETLSSNTKSVEIKSSSFSASITSTSSTRKTYNLRPRTTKTTSFTQASTPSTSSNPSTSTSTIFADTSKTHATRSSLVTERTSSRSPFITTIYRTRVYPRPLTSRSTVNIFPVSSTTRSTVKIYPLGSTTKSTVKIFPLTSKIQKVSPSISTTGRFSFTPSTQSAEISQRSTSVPEQFALHVTTHASTTDTSRHSPITVISISLVVILCVAGGLAYYMKKYRPRRRSKLAEDSEMLLI